MAKREKINPHPRGSAEHTLFNSYRRAKLEADRLEAEANRLAIDAGAARAKATHYAAALAALGHAVPGEAKMLEGPKA